MSLTIANMISRAADDLGLDTTDSTLAALVRTWTNDVIQDVNSSEEWPYLYGEKIIQTEPDKVGGTVGINARSTAVIGSNTNFEQADIGKFIQFPTTKDWYEIISITDLTNLTISPAFVGSANISGAAYTLRKFYYELPSKFDIPLTFRHAQSTRKLIQLTYREVDRNIAFGTAVGIPFYYYIGKRNINRKFEVAFYPYPSSVMNMWVRGKLIEEAYTQSDIEPLIPNEFRNLVIVEGVKARAMVYLNDPRWQTQKVIFESNMEKMRERLLSEPDRHNIIQNIDYAIRRIEPVPFPQEYDTQL